MSWLQMFCMNLSKMTIEADSTYKILYIRDLPKPEIISIEHDVKYRNLEESFFNGFTPKDFTTLNRNAKEVLKQKAIQQHLLEKAEQQGAEVLDVIDFMAKGAGWTVEVQRRMFEDINSPDSSELKN